MGYVEPALVYVPVSQAAGTSITVVMRTAGEPLALGRLLQEEMSRLDSNVPVYDVRTMAQRYSEFLAHPRFRAILMGILAGLTFVLAAIGIYGVLAQVVSQRTQEIGIRLTLGAEPSQVFRLVFREGMATAGIGVVIGILGGIRIDSTHLNNALWRGTDRPVCLHCSHNESNFGRTLSMLCSGATGHARPSNSGTEIRIRSS